MPNMNRRKSDQCLYRVYMSWDGWQSQTTAVCESLADAMAWVADSDDEGEMSRLSFRVERFRFDSFVVSKT